ncbi:metallophosphoesterase family protein, partial [bacterium]|nr:metallophosphoesterase family protein [bacterium]
SDTHLTRDNDIAVLDQIAAGPFADVDMILHAGDLVDRGIFDLAFPDIPFQAVAGNMDFGALATSLPSVDVIRVERARIGLIHGHGLTGEFPANLREQFRDVKAIVFGHSHVPYCAVHDGVLYFNPGSPIFPRGGHAPSVGLLTVNGDRIEGRHVVIA